MYDDVELITSVKSFIAEAEVVKYDVPPPNLQLHAKEKDKKGVLIHFDQNRKAKSCKNIWCCDSQQKNIFHTAALKKDRQQNEAWQNVSQRNDT